MKKGKLIWLLVVLAICMNSITIYADKNDDDNTKKMVQEWINSVNEASSLEEAEKYVCADEFRNTIITQIRELKGIEVLSAKVIDSEKSRDAVLFTFKNADQQEQTSLLMFYRNENNEYIECEDTEIQTTIVSRHVCSACEGTGSVLAMDAIVCGICSGTGQQYMPNLYYDTVLGWTGGYIGCSGCGGSGYISGYNICSNCGGLGIVY